MSDLVHHIRKEDLRDGSARVVDPPYPSFDIVLRRDFDVLAARVQELETALEQIAAYIEAEYREGDKPFQVAIIARAVLVSREPA